MSRLWITCDDESYNTGGVYESIAQCELPPPYTSTTVLDVFPDDSDNKDSLETEVRHWILNLTQLFRDPDCEKYFITYLETPNRWRRVTVFCDYRAAPPASLERDLQELRHPKDRSFRIYEAIQQCLLDIAFWDTVTHLHVETSGGRLRVRVAEDSKEIIPYPLVSDHRHFRFRLIRESDIIFDSFLSAFVYKVHFEGKDYVKKDIPSPDSVERILYEISALQALSDSEGVIQCEGIVVDDDEEVVKGLLISFAEQGPLDEVIFKFKGKLIWERRERWAKGIVQGLANIHEAGYVHGDLTLSNIVIDASDHAKITDPNRIGCSKGWEPPELRDVIASKTLTSPYLGIKTDLYQLGMILWAVAAQEDRPEEHRPLRLPEPKRELPAYYKRLFTICLSHRPQDRLSAKELLAQFPALDEQAPILSRSHQSQPARLHNRLSGRVGFLPVNRLSGLY